MAKTSYLISERIAQGGMAEIYLGKAVGDDAFQRIVAVKRILPHYAKDKDFVAMFRDEAHICKRLQHANIVQVYDFTEVENSYALIMEHIDGADFRTLLSACEGVNRRLSVAMVLYIVAGAARGLHYAHTKTDEITHKPLGIVHRDISPQNILISYEGEVKITDFGIASADDKVTETRPGVVKGKYSYMSPEQVAAKHLDGRTDIFSLAVVLWEALTMKRLFAGKSEVETIRRVQNCEIPKNINQYNNEVSEELIEIVMKGLSKEPKDRYQTGAEFEKALLRYLNSTYPEFLASHLGDFLKQLLSDKFVQSRAAQKKTLTSTSLSGINKSEAGTKHLKSSKHDLQIDPPNPNQKIIPLPLASQRGINNGVDIHGALATSTRIPQFNASKSKLKRLETAVHIRPTLKKSSKSTSWILPFLTLAMVAGVGYLNRHRLIPQQQLKLFIKTIPRAVQIYIDGQNIQTLKSTKPSRGEDKRHTLTTKPIILPAIPGNHRIDIRRAGYKSISLSYNGDETAAITKAYRLTKAPNSHLVSLKISSKDKVLVDIDYGLMKGRTPFVARNLLSSSNHVAQIYFVETKKMAQCTFRLPSTRLETLYLVIEGESKLRCLPKTAP